MKRSRRDVPTSDSLSVTDPANENNDLSELLNSGVRSQLSTAEQLGE